MIRDNGSDGQLWVYLALLFVAWLAFLAWAIWRTWQDYRRVGARHHRPDLTRKERRALKKATNCPEDEDEFFRYFGTTAKPKKGWWEP